MNDYLELLAIDQRRITQPSFVARVEQVVLQIEGARDPSSAAIVRKALLATMAQAQIDPALEQQYKLLLARLQLCRLARLSDAEVQELFNAHLVALLKNEDVQLDERVKDAIVQIIVPELAQVFADRIIQALAACTATLGTQNLQTSQGSESPMVGAWIRLLNASIPAERDPRQVDVAQFLTATPAVRALAPEDRKVLERSINVYLMLRFPEGRLRIDFFETLLAGEEMAYTEEPSGRGEDRATTPADAQRSPNELLAAWRDAHATELNSVYAAEDTVLAEIRAKHEKVREVLWDAAERKDLVRAVASLKVLAKMGALHEIFARPDVAEVVAPYIERKFGQVARSGFAKNPNRPQYVAALLRFVLEEKLALSEQDAALWAMPVLKLLETQDPTFARAVYFDESMGSFRWNTELSAVGAGK